MKSARLLLISVGVLLVVVASLVGVALLPSVQRWAVLRAARDVPGLKLEVAEVSAGFSGLTLRGVQAEKQRVAVKMDRLDADFSLFALVFSQRLVVSRLAVTGLFVDATRVSSHKVEAAAAGAPVATPGLLGGLELPFDLTLDEARIEGRALMPGAAGQPPLDLGFTVSGGKFAPGQEGMLQLVATVKNPAPGAKVTTLTSHAALRAMLTPQRTFNKLSLTTVVDAEGAALSGQSQLKVTADLFRGSAGENYAITVDTLLHGATENVLQLRAQLAASNHQFSGDWTLKVRNGQLEPFSLGGTLPDFDLRGSGRFAFDPATANSSAQGALQGQVSRLEAIDPAWRAFGIVTVDTTFDAGLQDGILNLTQFKAVLAGAQPVLEMQTAAPVRFDLRKRQLLTSGAGVDKLLGVKLQGLPLDWVRPFVSAVDITGGQITGQFDVVMASGSGAAAAVSGQCAIDQITVMEAGRPLVTQARVTAKGDAVIADGIVRIPALNVTVATPAGDQFAIQGKAATGTAAGAPVSAEGTFTASTAKLLARWFPGAPVTAAGELKLTLQGKRLELQPGRVLVQQGAGKLLVGVTITQPFVFDAQAQTLQAQDPAQPVARVELGALPLGALPLGQPDATLGGFLSKGVFELRSQGGKISFRSVGPLALSDVSLVQNRQPMLTGLAIEAQPVLEYVVADGLKIQSGDVTIRNAAKATLATLKADVTQAPDHEVRAVMSFNLEVPVLSTQPVFAGAQVVTAGKASGEIRAATGAQSQLEARLTLNGLVAAESGQTLPVANLSFRSLVQADGSISVQAPLLLDNAGRRSDLKFALDLAPQGKGYTVHGSLTGQQIELEDVMNVLSVFLASAAPDSADKPVAATGTVAPDTVASWSRFSGQLGLDIKTLSRGKDWAMTGLLGTLTIDPTHVSLQKLAAAFSETSRLSAQAELLFAGGAMPYRLSGEYSLNDFDAGRLFKALEPGKAPTVEGLFTVAGKLSGNGETPGRALERAHGDFQLTSRKGIFRGLQRTSNKVSMTSKAVELGASVLGSIFGSEKATKTAEKVAGQAYFVDQLAQSIGELNYDLLSVHLTRDELLNMNLQDISLVSPEIRLNGRGDVSYVVGKPLLEQPLSASLSIAARGKTEQLLGKLRLLDGTKDELGYSRTKDAVTVAGTLAKPDPTGFFTKIATAKLADFLDAEN